MDFSLISNNSNNTSVSGKKKQQQKNTTKIEDFSKGPSNSKANTFFLGCWGEGKVPDPTPEISVKSTLSLQNTELKTN